MIKPETVFDSKILPTQNFNTQNILYNFINVISEAVIITDLKFCILNFNATAEAFYNLPVIDTIGKPIFDIFDFEMIGTDLQEAMADFMVSGVWQGRINVKKPYGDIIYYETTATILCDETGEKKSIAIISQNITNKINYNESIDQLEEQHATIFEALSEGIILFNADGTIATCNFSAAKIFGFTKERLNKNFVVDVDWIGIKEDGSFFPPDEYPAIQSLKYGKEFSDVIMGLTGPKRKLIWISINSKPLFKNNSTEPYSAVATFRDITDKKITNGKLKESEILFRTFMKNTSAFSWIYDEFGNLIYGNNQFLNRVGLDESYLGKNIVETTSNKQVHEMVFSKIRNVLNSKETCISEDHLQDLEGNIKTYIAYWFLLPTDGDKKFIGGQAIDITEIKKAQQQISQMHDRFSYAVNASTDAIWDLDLKTNEIYRSDAFSSLSGYSVEEIEPNINWWIDKIHPDDRERVSQKVNTHLTGGPSHWGDEYRFKYADGTYKHLYDRGFAVYENEKPVRLVGSIQDITERKNLEAQLLHEQVQKQKHINQAIIDAQEKERGMISAELHDNVNQLIMSAKMHIGVAKNNPEKSNQLLENASDYLMMAVEEIRNLTKKLNSSVVKTVGLKNSILEICTNLFTLNEINCTANINEQLINKLSNEKQLMIFRIVQEQTNNIIKYADASNANITLEEKENACHLSISDNGKGADLQNKNNAKGIGLLNINNRVDAYNGTIQIETNEGNGFKLQVVFPIEDKKNYVG